MGQILSLMKVSQDDEKHCSSWKLHLNLTFKAILFYMLNKHSQQQKKSRSPVTVRVFANNFIVKKYKH